jgi:hypothetical protein
MVSFDVTQDRESLDHARDLEPVERPVERPFHDLWRNGGESEKRSPCPQRVMEPVKIIKAISETRY